MSDPAYDLADFMDEIGRFPVAPRYGVEPATEAAGWPDDGSAHLLLGDCLAHMVDIPDHSIDCIISDPPYPEIDRPYGRMTEAEWDRMMREVVRESRRVLKPTGSAVFVLQPNSEKVGRMRPWLWDFLAWTSREWNQVQDAWWWNHTAMPAGEGIKRHHGLMRGSVKACVWLGPPDCFRDQDAVLWEAHQAARAEALSRRWHRDRHENRNHSGNKVNNRKTMSAACVERDGSTPFNLLPCPGADRWTGGGTLGHPASTPETLCDWWVRYISPEGGTVLDPFMGSGTVGVAALRLGRKFIGIERYPAYFTMAQARIADAHRPVSKLDPAPPRAPLPGQLSLWGEGEGG